MSSLTHINNLDNSFLCNRYFIGFYAESNWFSFSLIKYPIAINFYFFHWFYLILYCLKNTYVSLLKYNFTT